MIYSFQPWSQLVPSAAQLGVPSILLTCIACLLIVVIAGFARTSGKKMALMVAIAVVVVPSLNWWREYQDPAYGPVGNEEVRAELVSSTQHTESVKTGKHGYRNETYAYVVYRVPEGLVHFKTQQGAVYPESVILYKKVPK